MSAFAEQSLPELRRVFDDLVAEHEAGLHRFCRSFLRDENLAADASQETLLRLWRNVLLGDPPEQPAAWLRQVAARCATDLLRGRNRQQDALEILAQPRPAKTVTSSLETAADRELRRVYESTLQELPEQQRMTFLLRHEAGMPLREVAEALQLALPTVKTHLARACIKLQAGLRAFREETD